MLPDHALGSWIYHLLSQILKEDLMYLILTIITNSMSTVYEQISYYSSVW